MDNFMPIISNLMATKFCSHFHGQLKNGHEIFVQLKIGIFTGH